MEDQDLFILHGIANAVTSDVLAMQGARGAFQEHLWALKSKSFYIFTCE